jgi:hypothetical protein
MLVNIDSYKYGGYVLRPKSYRYIAKIHIDMITKGAGPDDITQSVLIGEDDIEGLGLSPRTLKELKHGYSVCCIIDSWLVRQLYGYCKG